jgi:proteasome accessory factor B
MQRLEVEFDYAKPNSGYERRRVRPYHLANRENSWYLVGFDLARKDIRNFAVVRMRSVIVHSEKFEKPADFSPEKHFGRSFGAYVGKGDHKVVIRFSQAVTARLKERIWHETLETRDLPGGGLEFTLKLDSLDEIERWILGWGPAAEVIEPKELRDSVEAKAKAVAALYEG